MNNALVKAANDMVIANSAIQMPLSEPLAKSGRRGEHIGVCTVDDMKSF
jgi:hypothetical protein